MFYLFFSIMFETISKVNKWDCDSIRKTRIKEISKIMIQWGNLIKIVSRFINYKSTPYI